jgi:hypothetical protein
MLWFLAVLMGGLGFGYVTFRRKRMALATLGGSPHPPVPTPLDRFIATESSSWQ